MMEAKPCPFCGSNNVGGFNDAFFLGGVKVGFTVVVSCGDCHAAIISVDKDKSINDMIQLWNRRAENGG